MPIEETETESEGFPARDVLRFVVEQAFSKGALQEGELRIMVASFSEEGDQLSQWRGYANNACGVSIGLNLSDLRPPRDIGTLATFAPCVYEDSQKCSLLRSVLKPLKDAMKLPWDAAMTRFKEMAREIPPGQSAINQMELLKQKIISQYIFKSKDVLGPYQGFIHDLLRVAPLLKNESFSEEREWRLVLPWFAKNAPKNHKVEYRCVRDAIIPYVAFPLQPPGPGQFPCRALILGPGSHPDAELGMNMFLNDNGIIATAAKSTIPYRPG